MWFTISLQPAVRVDSKLLIKHKSKSGCVTRCILALCLIPDGIRNQFLKYPVSTEGIDRSRGRTQRRPPMGPNSFIFTYISNKKSPHERLMPPNGWRPPQPEILDLPLEGIRKQLIKAP